MKTRKLMLTAICLSLLFFGCNPGNSDAPDETMSANIGTSSFSAHGTFVQGLISTNPSDNTKTQLTVTGASGITVLVVAVFNFRNTTGTFDFSTGAALGGYTSAIGGSEDVFVSGSLIITSVTDHLVQGTFTGKTLTGVSITNGSFSINK